jgi:hypothetical protein
VNTRRTGEGLASIHVRVVGEKVRLRKTGHEWYFPEDGLGPGAGRSDLDMTMVGTGSGYRDESDRDLLWLEAILSEPVEIRWLEVRTVLLEVSSFLGCKREGGEVCSDFLSTFRKSRCNVRGMLSLKRSMHFLEK